MFEKEAKTCMSCKNKNCYIATLPEEKKTNSTIKYRCNTCNKEYWQWQMIDSLTCISCFRRNKK